MSTKTWQILKIFGLYRYKMHCCEQLRTKTKWDLFGIFLFQMWLVDLSSTLFRIQTLFEVIYYLLKDCWTDSVWESKMSTTQLRRRSSVLFHSNSNQFPSKKTSLTDPVNANSGLGGEGPKYKESVCSTTPDSEIGIQHELLARINSSQSTLTSSLTMDDEHISENIVELNFFYGIVKRNLLIKYTSK